jgi:hypothetical protein
MVLDLGAVPALDFIPDLVVYIGSYFASVCHYFNLVKIGDCDE